MSHASASSPMVSWAMMAFTILLFLGLSLPISAEEIHVYPSDDLWTQLKNLNAGDVVVVHEGIYATTGKVHLTLEGTEEAPIVVRAAAGEAVHIQGIPTQNIIDIGGSWYVWSGFEMSGGSHGIRVENSAHARFERLHIHDTGDVGISCNRTDHEYDDITIRGLEIHDTHGTGECMYLGCNNGTCILKNSLIEFNHCHDTLQATQGDGIEVKSGSYNVVIRHNVIHDVKYPGITLYGTYGELPNVVEGNAIWNTGDNGIQLVGDAIVINNIVVNAGQNGIHSKSSQGDTPHDLFIAHNTVIGAGDACLRGNGWSDAVDVVVANNAFYCPTSTAVKLPNGFGLALFVSNAVLGNDQSPEGTFQGISIEADLSDAENLDVYPTPESILVGSGDSAYTVDTDFDCTTRDLDSPTLGAYAYAETGSPAWIVEPGFKTSCAGEPDAGGTDDVEESFDVDDDTEEGDPDIFHEDDGTPSFDSDPGEDGATSDLGGLTDGKADVETLGQGGIDPDALQSENPETGENVPPAQPKPGEDSGCRASNNGQVPTASIVFFLLALYGCARTRGIQRQGSSLNTFRALFLREQFWAPKSENQ